MPTVGARTPSVLLKTPFTETQGEFSPDGGARNALTGSTDRPRLLFPAWNAPVLSNGRLYLRGRDQILCLRVGK